MERGDAGRPRDRRRRRDGGDRGAGPRHAARRGAAPRSLRAVVAGLHGDHRAIQRARPVHRAYRLRVDAEPRPGQQPAPQRHLPRRQGGRRHDGALHHVRERRSRRPLGLDGGLRGDHRRPSACNPAQRQPVERPDVRRRDLFRRAADGGLCRATAALRADLRGDADQGRRRGASVAVARRRVRRLRDLGRGQPQPDPQGGRRPRQGILARGAEARHGVRAGAGREPVQNRRRRWVGRAHRAHRDRGGQLLRQALGRRAIAEPVGTRGAGIRGARDPRLAAERRRATPPSGPPTTRARRSGTR